MKLRLLKHIPLHVFREASGGIGQPPSADIRPATYSPSSRISSVYLDSAGLTVYANRMKRCATAAISG